MRIRLQHIETMGCQAINWCRQRLDSVGSRSRFFQNGLAIASGLLVLGGSYAQARSTDDAEIPDRLFTGTTVPEHARALAQTTSGSARREKLISPPGENPYYPVRSDGQPFVLNVDTTVNLTSALNEFYWNPKWRGEVWSPFDLPETVERASRLMSTWPEYDSENMFRVGTKPAQWLERYSGYGP